MDSNLNNDQQDSTQNNQSLDIFTRPMPTGSEPVSVEPTEVVTPVETVVETPVVSETGSEPVSVEPTEAVTPVETVVETPVVSETGSEPVSVEPTEAVTTVEPVVETPVVSETGSEPVSVEPTEAVTPVETVVETPVVSETGNEPVNVQTVEPTKKSNKGLVTIIVIILLALVGVGIYFFLNKDNKDKEQSGDKPNSNVVNSSSSTTKNTSGVECKNGLYEKDNKEIAVYCNKNNKSLNYAFLDNDSDDSYRTNIRFKKAYFEGSKARNFNEYLWFENGKLNFKDEKGNEIVLDKINDFTSKEYFEINYLGSDKLLTGQYNALYKKDNSIIVIYPTTGGKLALYYASADNGKIKPDFDKFLDGHGISSNGNQTNAFFALEKNNDGSFSYEEDSFFESKLKLSISLNNGNLVAKVELDKENYLPNFAGTYTKVKDLTAEDIVENNFE